MGLPTDGLLDRTFRRRGLRPGGADHLLGRVDAVRPQGPGTAGRVRGERASFEIRSVDQDGTPSDAWSRYEIPRRYDAFTRAPGFGRIGCRRSVPGEVRYVPVADDHGVLGHLWASETEPAASFEPLDLEDDERCRTALTWLDRPLRLRSGTVALPGPHGADGTIAGRHRGARGPGGAACTAEDA